MNNLSYITECTCIIHTVCILEPAEEPAFPGEGLLHLPAGHVLPGL